MSPSMMQETAEKTYAAGSWPEDFLQAEPFLRVLKDKVKRDKKGSVRRVAGRKSRFLTSCDVMSVQTNKKCQASPAQRPRSQSNLSDWVQV